MKDWAIVVAVVLLMFAGQIEELLDSVLRYYVLAVAFWLFVSGLIDYVLKKIGAMITKKKGDRYWYGNTWAQISFVIISILRLCIVAYAITFIGVHEPDASYLTLAIVAVDTIYNLWEWMMRNSSEEHFHSTLGFGNTVGSWLFLLYCITKLKYL